MRNKKSFKSNSLKYIINEDVLKRGDIILTTSNHKISRIIKLTTSGNFSHAMLYVDVLSCIESTLEGVSAVNMQRVLFENLSFCKILRYKHELNEDTIDDVITYARQKVGTEYSVKEAINAGIKYRKGVQKINRQFCSRLVAQAYHSAGVPIVKDPNYSSPEEIHRSPKLVEVKCALREAKPAEIRFANEKNSPIDQQKIIQKNILAAIRNLTKIDIQTFEQIGGCVIEFPEYDEAICDIIRKSGYLDFWKVDIERNPWNYDVEACMQHFVPSQMQKMLKLLNEGETRKRFIMTLDSLIEQQQLTHRQYFKDHIVLYKTLLRLSEERENTLNMALLLSEIIQ